MVICLKQSANDLHGPADVTTTHHLLLRQHPNGFVFLVLAYPGCPVKEAVGRE